MKKTYAFISYSTKNQQVADAIKHVLDEKGIQNWMAPYDIPVGEEYVTVIDQAIEKSSCVVLLLSKDAQKSIWVKKEITRAVSNGKTVIPIQIEKVVLNSSFKFLLCDTQIVALPNLDQSSPEFQKMVSAVEALVEYNDNKTSDSDNDVYTYRYTERTTEDFKKESEEVKDKTVRDQNLTNLRKEFFSCINITRERNKKVCKKLFLISGIIGAIGLFVIDSINGVSLLGSILFSCGVTGFVICLLALYLESVKGPVSIELTILKAKLILAEEENGLQVLDKDIKRVIEAIASSVTLPYNGQITAPNLKEICKISGLNINKETLYYTARLINGYNPKQS